MRRLLTWFVATVCAGAGIGVVTVAAISQSTSLPYSSGPSWPDRFAQCSTSYASVAAMDLSETCVFSHILDAFSTGQVDPMMEGLAVADMTAPGFHVICHSAGHRAGQRVFEQIRDLGYLLSVFDSTACAYAIGHGVIDGFGLSHPSEGDFVEAVRACESFSKSQGPLFTACADGMGHAAWTSTGEFPAAFARCESFTAAGSQSLCAEGIVMQVYEPVGVLPARPIAQAPSELPRLCRALGDSRALSLGCHAGAGYIYSRPWWALEARFQAAVSGVNMAPPVTSEFVDLARSIVSLCDRHHDWASSCYRGAIAQIPPTVRTTPDLVGQVCAHFQALVREC